MKRSDFEKNVSTSQANHERINSKLEELAQREKTLQDAVNSELITVGESKSLDELTSIKVKIDALQKARVFAEKEIGTAKQALSDFSRAELVGQVYALDKQCLALVAEIQEMIGENGVNGKLAQIHSLLDAMGGVSTVGISQEVQGHRAFYFRLCQDLGTDLIDYWRKIEGLPDVPKPPRPMEKAGHIPGFGRLPGRIV
jgi:hypothetical protein